MMARFNDTFRFLSTPSARRATGHCVDVTLHQLISIHALREEGDGQSDGAPLLGGLFLSTPSARRATDRPRSCCSCPHDFYPRPPRGGRQIPYRRYPSMDKFLSTPSARRATPDGQPRHLRRQISIHALREEGDWVRDRIGTRLFEFLSTPSARRATSGRRLRTRRGIHFYPRPPRGGRPSEKPRSEGFCRFLSTPSARRATYSYDEHVKLAEISIHALREEGDFASKVTAVPPFNFYPRPPRGGRPIYFAGSVEELEFLSTPSARRATWMTNRSGRNVP